MKPFEINITSHDKYLRELSMKVSGFIADFIMGYHDLKELNFDKFIINKMKEEFDITSNNIKKFILKTSLIYLPKRSSFLDIPYILYDIRKVWLFAIEKSGEIFGSVKYRGYTYNFFSNELVLDIKSENGRLLLFRPKIYPVDLLEEWYDAWTRPSILCESREVSQIYFLIPPKYSIIKKASYRVSIRDDFRDIMHEYGRVYDNSSGDRDYVAIPWSCHEPDWIEIKAQIKILNGINEYKRHTGMRRLQKRFISYVKVAFEIIKSLSPFIPI